MLDPTARKLREKSAESPSAKHAKSSDEGRSWTKHILEDFKRGN